MKIISDIYIKTKVRIFSEDSSVVTLAEILKSVETFLDFLIIIHQKNLKHQQIKFLLFIKLSVAFISKSKQFREIYFESFFFIVSMYSRGRKYS